MDRIDGKGKVSDKFDAAVSHIAASLDTLSSLSAQTIEHHAILNGTELLSGIQSLNEWIGGDMSMWKSQIANILREENVPKLTVMVYADLIHKMDTLKEEIDMNGNPNFQDISKWNRKKQEIITIYGQILKDEMDKGPNLGSKRAPKKKNLPKENPLPETPVAPKAPHVSILLPEQVRLTALRDDIIVNIGTIYKDMENFIKHAPSKAKETGKVYSETFHGIYFDGKEYSVIAYQDTVHGSKAGFSIIIPNMESQEIPSPKDFMNFMITTTGEKYQQMSRDLAAKSKRKEPKDTSDVVQSSQKQKITDKDALSSLNDTIERDIDRVSVELETFISNAPLYIKEHGI